MRFQCTCIVCKKQFITQWKTATCGEVACRLSLGDTEERRFFFDRVVKRDDRCWEWMGGLDKEGNPVVNFKKKVVTAYKFYKTHIEGIDIGMNRLSRSCGLQKCVNPDHFMNDWDRMESRIKVDPETGCHVWTASKDKDGYALGTLGGRSGRLARILWEETHGEIQDDKLQVCHTCDFPPCLNLAHLFLGTAKDNSDDKRKKNREARGERTMVAVLNEETVEKARILRSGGMLITDIAKSLNVSSSESAILVACQGRTWSHAAGPITPAVSVKLSHEIAKEIRLLSSSGMSNGAIAIKLNLDCCEQTIKNVISGVSWIETS